jgi:hypothetical protein
MARRHPSPKGHAPLEASQLCVFFLTAESQAPFRIRSEPVMLNRGLEKIAFTG